MKVLILNKEQWLWEQLGAGSGSGANYDRYATEGYGSTCDITYGFGYGRADGSGDCKYGTSTGSGYILGSGDGRGSGE
jgi:hypothetical protein